MPKQLMTLCFVFEGTRILLGRKKQGLGMGNYNGFGGKVDPGETIESAAVREVAEEAGIAVTNLKSCGVLEFIIDGHPSELEVHVFTTRTFTGVAKDTEEMKPRWFEISAMPYGQMWADDRYWLPHLLAGKFFTGRFHFSNNHTLLDWELRQK